MNGSERERRERIQARMCIENATQNFQERKEARLTNRLHNAQNAQNIDNQVKSEMENRITQRLNKNNGTSGGHGNN